MCDPAVRFEGDHVHLTIFTQDEELACLRVSLTGSEPPCGRFFSSFDVFGENFDFEAITYDGESFLVHRQFDDTQVQPEPRIEGLFYCTLGEMLHDDYMEVTVHRFWVSSDVSHHVISFGPLFHLTMRNPAYQVHGTEVDTSISTTAIKSIVHAEMMPYQLLVVLENKEIITHPIHNLIYGGFDLQAFHSYRKPVREIIRTVLILLASMGHRTFLNSRMSVNTPLLWTHVKQVIEWL